MQGSLSKWPANLRCGYCGALLVPLLTDYAGYVRDPEKSKQISLRCSLCDKAATVNEDTLAQIVPVERTVDLSHMEESEMAEPLDPMTDMDDDQRLIFAEMVELYQQLVDSGISGKQIKASLEV